MPPLLLLPGNHDRYDPPLFLPGGTLFDRFFGHYWEVGQRVKAWEFPPKEGVRLGLVSADLSLRKKDPGVGFFGRYGQGRAYVDLIEELEALTDEMSHFGLLWVVHFPPKYPNIDNLLSLLDDENLIKAAHRKGISHLLAGHTHFPHAYNALSADGSAVKVLCAGSATQCVAPEGNFIHDLRIEVGNGKIVSLSFQTYQWSEADQKWVPAACPEKP